MTQEDKELLLKDLCARLPYGVKVEVKNYRCNGEVRNVEIETLNVEHLTCPIERYRPYLRPMSSVTEEERKEYQSLCEIHFECDADANFMVYYFDTIESFDWLNKKMFDYRGLIPKDLALSTEVFNPYKSI